MDKSNSKKTSKRSKGGLRLTGQVKCGKGNQPLVTIITVVYNGGDHIEQAIRSVISQSYDNIEYIVIDGGSTDQTLDIIRKHENQIDYWISEPDHGIYDAMNKAIKCSSGDWLMFLGADDVLLNSVQIFVESITDNACVYYGNVKFTNNEKLYDGKFNMLKLIRKNIPHQGIFYPRSIFDKALFETKYELLADYVYNLKMFTTTRYIYVPITVAQFNEHGASGLRSDAVFRGEIRGIVKEYYPFLVFLLFAVGQWCVSFFKKPNGYYT